MIISTGPYGNCEYLHELLEVQHEYSKFVTIRETCNLGTSDDIDYCINILNCIPNIDFDKAKAEILELTGYDEKTGWFSKKCAGEDWDYEMLDDILMKYVGRELYREYR